LAEFGGGEEWGDGFFRDVIFHSGTCCDASYRWR
jgi:hypothetical protein